MATIVYICSLDIQIFLGDKIKKNIDLTRGWIEVGSWLEVDLGSRLARVTPQLWWWLQTTQTRKFNVIKEGVTIQQSMASAYANNQSWLYSKKENIYTREFVEGKTLFNGNKIWLHMQK